jgi:hypothetical protein
MCAKHAPVGAIKKISPVRKITFDADGSFTSADGLSKK